MPRFNGAADFMTPDKQAHFFAGAAIASTIALYLGPVLGLVVGIVAGVVKELYDRIGYGTPDTKDFIATALGSCVVAPYVFML
jgi:hypothetical protein